VITKHEEEKRFSVNKPLDQVEISPNLKAIITANLDRLDSVQQMILKVSSVLGSVIDVKVLEGVSFFIFLVFWGGKGFFGYFGVDGNSFF
jgi:hypothetical protein